MPLIQVTIMPFWPFKDSDTGIKDTAPYSNRPQPAPAPAPAPQQKKGADPNIPADQLGGMTGNAVKSIRDRKKLLESY